MNVQSLRRWQEGVGGTDPLLRVSKALISRSEFQVSLCRRAVCPPTTLILMKFNMGEGGAAEYKFDHNLVFMIGNIFMTLLRK
jgi:hypothetical protein